MARPFGQVIAWLKAPHAKFQIECPGVFPSVPYRAVLSEKMHFGDVPRQV